MTDTTQQETVEAPQEDNVEATNEGVQEEVTQQAEITPQPSEDEADRQAEESLFKSLRDKKGWKSEEDMAKAYAELESSHTRKSQEVSDFENLLEALVQEDDQQPVYDYREAVAREVDPLRAQLDIAKVSRRHADFGELEGKMSEILLDNADRKELFKGEKGIELLYRMAKTEQQDALVEQAKVEGRKEASATEADKIRAQVESGTKAKQPPKHIFTRQEIADMSVEDYQKNREEIEVQAQAGQIK